MLCTTEGITYGFIEEELGAAARAIGVTTHQEPLAGPPFVVVASNTYKQVQAHGSSCASELSQGVKHLALPL